MPLDVQTSPQSSAPKPEEFNKAVDAQASSMEQSLEELAPVADYSSGRLNALGKALDSVVSLFGQLPPTEPSANIKQGKLPVGILLRIAAVRAAVQAWHESDETVDIQLADIPELNSDGAIAMFTVALQKLAQDKDFKKFLKAPAKAPVAEAPESAQAEQKDVIPDLGEQGNKDMETMFPSK